MTQSLSHRRLRRFRHANPELLFRFFEEVLAADIHLVDEDSRFFIAAIASMLFRNGTPAIDLFGHVTTVDERPILTVYDRLGTAAAAAMAP